MYDLDILSSTSNVKVGRSLSLPRWCECLRIPVFWNIRIAWGLCGCLLKWISKHIVCHMYINSISRNSFLWKYFYVLLYLIMRDTLPFLLDINVIDLKQWIFKLDVTLNYVFRWNLFSSKPHIIWRETFCAQLPLVYYKINRTLLRLNFFFDNFIQINTWWELSI